MARNGNDNLIEFANAGSEGSSWQSALIDLSFEPIFAWDWNNGIIEWNAGAEKLYGFNRAEAIGKNSHEMLSTKHPVSLNRFLKVLAAEGYWIGEVRHTTRDGRELIVESRQQVMLRDGRRIVVEINRDITERRAGEGQIALLIIIGELISNMRKPTELLFAASKAVGEYFKAKRCLFNEIDVDKNLEVVHRDYCGRGVKSIAGNHKLSAYSSVTFAEMKSGRTVVNTDSKIDPRTSKLYKKTYEPAGERCYVAVPLMRDGSWKASLWISDDCPREWSRAEIALIEIVAERVWLAVEKYRSDKALSDSEQNFRAVFTQTSAGIAQTDLTGRFLLVNDCYCELVGRTREELMNLRMQDITHPDDLTANLKQFEAVVKGRKSNFAIEKRYVRPDGVEVWAHIHVSKIRDSKGNPIYIVAAATDITERKKAVEALRESEESYRVLTEAASDAIIRIDEDSIIRFVNSAASRVFGYTEEELTGQSLTMLIPENLRSAHRAGFARYLDTGVRNLNWESIQVPAQHKDSHHFPIEISFGEYNRDGKRFFIGIARDITERKKAIEDLRESEARRQMAQDAGNIGIFDWEIAGEKAYWSDTMWSFYGEEPLDINPVDAYWSDHLHDHDRERVLRNLRLFAESRESEFQDEFRIVRTDGTIRWLEARAKVSRDESGKAIRMYGVNNDITPRKEAEERIRASENQLRLVTSSVPALISYVDRDERYRFANETFTDWFGVPTAEIIGMQPRDIFGPAAYEVLKPRIDQALSGKKCSFETVLTYKDIGDRFVSVSYLPDIGSDGTVYGYYGLTHDLTDLKQSQELLRSSEERISLMLESLTDYAIVSLNDNGVINGWNKGAETIFGYSQDEILQRSVDNLFTAEDVINLAPQKEMATALKTGRASCERWLLRKDGTRFYAQGVMIPLYVGKTLTGYSKIVSDSTVKKRQEEELQQAHDELETRVTERTRELAETNAALIQEMRERHEAEEHRVELLGRLVASQEFERRRFARDLHDQMGQRLTALRLKIASLHELQPGDEQWTTRVNRLQEISQRLDSEVSFLAWELRPAALDDLGLVDAVNAFVNEWSRHHDITADFHSARLPKKRLDIEVETHLYRITQEALNNIAKHAQAKQVMVMLERREQSVILVIEDDGSGFDAAQKRVSSESGRGLGLVGMGERAGLIGGEIEIESKVGKGTTIFVRVPFL